MEQVMARIHEWFGDKDEYARVFAKQGSQVEGWFHGEMLCLFDALKNENKLREFKREDSVPAAEKRADFQLVTTKGKKQWMEIKADPHCHTAVKSVMNEMSRLQDVKDSEKSGKWIVAFVYPEPMLTKDQCKGLLDEIHEAHPMWECKTADHEHSGPLAVMAWSYQP